MMEASLLYKLHSNMVRPGVTVDPTKFKEVYRSQYGKVRIYQVLKVSAESKAWVADAANRICDAPGSWSEQSPQYPSWPSVFAPFSPTLESPRTFGSGRSTQRMALLGSARLFFVGESRYCVGQYPPALKDLISRRKNFAQLEDFNSKAKRDNEYTREYMARMNGEKRAESTKEVGPPPSFAGRGHRSFP